MVLDYIEYLLILVFKVAGCVSASAFASLAGIPINFVSSVVGLKTVITATIKKSKLITNKKSKKHNKIVLLTKDVLIYKLTIEV